MGSRGARLGISESGKEYGTEYETILKYRNIKFVRYRDSKSAKAPMETMTNGRVYGTVNNKNELSSITYYDKEGKRNKQIDLTHFHQLMNEKEKPHVHKGYEHDEKGTYTLNRKERKMVDLVNKVWEYYKDGK